METNNDHKRTTNINLTDPVQTQKKGGSGSGSSRSRNSRKSSSATAATNYRFVNMAEARREVALALQLHRSTSSSSAAHHHASIASAAASPSSQCKHDFGPAGGGCNYPTTSYCYSAVDTLPIPGPVWSTTSPAILAQPPPPPPVLALPAASASSSSLVILPESQHQQPLGLDCYGGDTYYYDEALSSKNYDYNNCIYTHAAAANGDIPDWWTSSADGGGGGLVVSDEVSKYFDQCYSAAECSPAGISPLTGGRLTIEEKPDI